MNFSNPNLYVLATALLLFSSCGSKQDLSGYADVIPPFESLQVESLKFEVNTNKDTLINVGKGTSVFIPKNAFETSDGKPIDGSVEIQFREFDSPTKIIASGIPMTYTDESGEQQQMESAGMFEIRGTSSGKEVFIKPDKQIDVNLSSNVSGDFDFFYLEEDETGTKGKWNTLLQVNLAEDQLDTSGRPLMFDTVKYPSTTLLADARFDIDGIGAESVDWVYDEPWEILSVSRPEVMSEVVANIKSNVHYDGWHNYLNPDSSLIETYWEGKIRFYDFEGNLVRTLENLEYEYGYYTDKGVYVACDVDKGGYDFYDSNWNLKKSLSGMVEFYTLKDGKGHVCINLPKTNKTHFYFDFLTDSGELVRSVKCKKHPRRGNSYYGTDLDKYKTDGLPGYTFSSERELVAMNTGDALLILDLQGNEVKRLENDAKYKDVDFLEYDDALVLEDWDGNLTVWDWKNDQMTSVPNDIVAKDYKYHSGHPNKPVLLVNNYDARFFLLWNWKTDEFTKHQTTHNTGQLRFTYGDDGKYIDEYHHRDSDGFRRLYDGNGKEIIKVEKLEERYVSLYPLESGTIISSNGKEFCVYDADGSILKKFSFSDSTYTDYTQYHENLILSNANGLASFLDNRGNYLRSVQVDRESRVGWGSHLFDSLFAVITPFGSLKLYTPNGRLIYDLGRNYPAYLKKESPDSAFVWINSEDDEVMLTKKGEPLKAENEYQITLKNEDKQFIGRVRLSLAAKRAIEKYEEQYLIDLRVSRKKEAARAERESKLVRSFQVKKFGIYNWDRMYKQPNAVLCKAKLNLNEPAAVSQYRSFLVTGDKKNTVVQYFGEKIDKFAFDPTSFNELVLILNDDRVAIVSNESFKAIKAGSLSETDELLLEPIAYNKAESADYLKDLVGY